jgi:hypothetical protein
MSYVPDEKKMCRARYSYEIHMYAGSSGETIFQGSQTRIISLVKDDSPISNDTVLPFLQIEVNVERDEEVKMQKHLDDICMRLSLTVEDQKHNPDNDKFETISDRVMFDEVFQVSVKTPLNPEVSSEENPALQNSEDSPMDPNMLQRFRSVKFLASIITHRNRTKPFLNFNLDNATVADALTYGLQQCVNDRGTVILQPPEADDTYTQITCPPWTLKDFINHMQTSYNLYKTGVIVYQDFKYLYVIPKWSEDYAVPEDEYNRVHMYFMDATVKNKPGGTGYYKDEESGRYVVVSGKTYKHIENQELLREVLGNKFRIYDYDKEQKSVSYEGESWGGIDAPLAEIREVNIVSTNKDSADRQKIYGNMPNSPLNEEALIRNIYNQSIVCAVDVENIDFSFMTFNRTYEFYFLDDVETDKRYGGLYQLISARLVLSQNQTEPLGMKGSLMFAYAE